MSYQYQNCILHLTFTQTTIAKPGFHNPNSTDFRQRLIGRRFRNRKLNLIPYENIFPTKGMSLQIRRKFTRLGKLISDPFHLADKNVKVFSAAAMIGVGNMQNIFASDRC